jgi:hypothetical protein
MEIPDHRKYPCQLKEIDILASACQVKRKFRVAGAQNFRIIVAYVQSE